MPDFRDRGVSIRVTNAGQKKLSLARRACITIIYNIIKYTCEIKGTQVSSFLSGVLRRCHFTFPFVAIFEYIHEKWNTYTSMYVYNNNTGTKHQAASTKHKAQCPWIGALDGKITVQNLWKTLKNTCFWVWAKTLRKNFTIYLGVGYRGWPINTRLTKNAQINIFTI